MCYFIYKSYKYCTTDLYTRYSVLVCRALHPIKISLEQSVVFSYFILEQQQGLKTNIQSLFQQIYINHFNNFKQLHQIYRYTLFNRAVAIRLGADAVRHDGSFGVHHPVSLCHWLLM